MIIKTQAQLEQAQAERDRLDMLPEEKRGLHEGKIAQITAEIELWEQTALS